VTGAEWLEKACEVHLLTYPTGAVAFVSRFLSSLLILPTFWDANVGIEISILK